MRTVRSLLSDRCKKRFRKHTFLGLTPVTWANMIWGKSPAFYLEVYVLVLFNHIYIAQLSLILHYTNVFFLTMKCLKVLVKKSTIFHWKFTKVDIYLFANTKVHLNAPNRYTFLGGQPVRTFIWTIRSTSLWTFLWKCQCTVLWLPIWSYMWISI